VKLLLVFLLVGVSSASIVDINHDNFKELLQTQSPLVVEFCRTECSACQAFEPNFLEVSYDLEKLATFGKFIIDDDTTYKWMATPTMVIFVDGVPVYFSRGYQNTTIIEKMIAEAL
jgi:thioredoxin-like negative regulator of GroEL